MKTKKSLLALLMAIILLVSAAACGPASVDSQIDTGNANDDFWTDTETVNSDNSGNAASGAQSGAVSNNNSTPTASTTQNDNKVGGKSWKEVLASMPKNLRGTTVKVANWNPMSEYAGAQSAIAEFEKQTGIKVEWQFINYDTYVTRLASSIASGQSPDLARTETPISTRLVSYQPLSKSGFDFSDAAWDQNLMKDYSVNGVAYATSLQNTHFGTVAMMLYNKELINKYNFENPYTLWKNGKWTVNKFLEMCKEFKNVSKEDYGCVGFTFESWVQMYGVQGPVGFDGKKYYNNLSNNTFLLQTQAIADLFNQSTTLAEGRDNIFDAGRCLFFAGKSVYARKKNSYFGALKSAGSLYAVPFPKVDGQSVYYQQRNEYEAYGIVKGAKNAKAAPYFLRYFLDGANYDLSSAMCNKQNLEVYNWCMSQPKTIWSTTYRVNGDDFGDAGTGIYTKKGNQIKSFIDANSAVIDRRVEQYNNAIKNLSK